MADVYGIKNGADGHIESVTYLGEEIPVSGVSQKFCLFIAWACALPEPPHPDLIRLPQGNYFGELKPVLAFCKSLRLLLFVDSSGPDPRLACDSVSPCLAGPNPLHFYKLSQATSARQHLREDGLEGKEMPLYVTGELLRQLNFQLKDEDSETRCLSSLPAEKAFVYLDVSDYSTYPPGQQVLVVRTLQRIVDGGQSIWGGGEAWTARGNLEATLCIGDGFIYVFRSAIDGGLVCGAACRCR